MSDVMLLGILRMPTDCWSGDPLDVLQRHSTYVRAAERIESDAVKLANVQAMQEDLMHKAARATRFARIAKRQGLPALQKEHLESAAHWQGLAEQLQACLVTPSNDAQPAHACDGEDHGAARTTAADQRATRAAVSDLPEVLRTKRAGRDQ